MPAPVELSPADLEELRARGKDPAEALRQLALVRNPPPPVRLVRPATLGDGILTLSPEEQADCEARGGEAIARGRVTKFVPASGAATRMFEALASGDGRALERFARERDKLNLGEDWRPATSLPKALIPFHRYPEGARTAFEEHLEEARQLGLRRLHFTVAAEQRPLFEALLARQRPGLEVTLSEQKPSTDTLATDGEGRPLRDPGGRLVFRPGGHGALLENLNQLGADLVLIKNVDNVSHARLWPEQLRWKRILLGVMLRELERSSGMPPAPVRACGVVKNSGEPGGGPFWVRRDDRVELHIVEAAQVDPHDPAQQALFASSTHFNPVDIAGHVQGFDLRRYRDDRGAFVVRKSRDGQPVLSLELPGLWNGSMADWRTVFVEVPAESFNPVKTLFDLLRPAHQPA